MDESLAFENAPHDSAQVATELDRMLEQIDQSHERLIAAERDFERMSAEIDAVLSGLRRKGYVEADLESS